MLLWCLQPLINSQTSGKKKKLILSSHVNFSLPLWRDRSSSFLSLCYLPLSYSCDLFLQLNVRVIYSYLGLDLDYIQFIDRFSVNGEPYNFEDFIQNLICFPAVVSLCKLFKIYTLSQILSLFFIYFYHIYLRCL